MPFVKGQSGNPSGKAKGETPKGRFRQQVEAALPSIVQGLIEAAQAGDVQAAGLILNKVVPNLKPTSDPVPLPQASNGTLAERGLKIITAAANGQLSPDDATASMALLIGQAKLVEQTEVISRLEAIESWLTKGKS